MISLISDIFVISENYGYKTKIDLKSPENLISGAFHIFKMLIAILGAKEDHWKRVVSKNHFATKFPSLGQIFGLAVYKHA